jgi:aminoglycoside 3-N-acetyltransferase
MRYTKEDLINNLIAAGFAPNDTVLIHSSMKSIGDVENGANGVLDALIEYFSKDGLLVFPTLSYNIYANEDMLFSYNDTPSVVGLLSEMFRTKAGVIRSMHPTHSVAALGKKAQEFTSNHQNDNTPCSRTSPWGKLYDYNGKILFIGVKNISCCTFFMLKLAQKSNLIYFIYVVLYHTYFEISIPFCKFLKTFLTFA